MLGYRSATVFVLLALWPTLAAAQFDDRRPEPPQPARWGVTAGVTPQWWTPGPWFALIYGDEDSKLKGRDLRVGIVHGRPLGFEFGASFVRKTLSKDSVLIRDVYAPVPGSSTGAAYEPLPNVSYTGIDSVVITGADAHVLIPAARVGKRVLIGVLLGAGFGSMKGLVQKRVAGPPFFARCDGSFSNPLADPPVGGGAVWDHYGRCYPIAPGARETTVSVDATEISRVPQGWPLVTGQVAVDALLTPSLKLRIAGGFNYPGAQLVGVDLVYLFGSAN